MASDKKKNEIIKKNNTSIHIDAKLSLVQKKLINALLFNAYESLLTSERHEIPYKLLSELIGYNSCDRDHIKSGLKGLTATPIEWGVIDENNNEIWEVAAMLSYAKLSGGVCTYGYAKELAQKLYNPETYTRINLEVQRKISSSHAFSLYENCLRYLKVGSTGWLDISTFRRLMGLYNNEYSEFSELNKFVIKKAVAEVNKNTDIYVEVQFKKIGRQISDIRFLVEKNKQSALFSVEEEDAIAQSDAYKKLLENGISKLLARQWVLEHGEEYILEKIAVTQLTAQSKPLKSISGFLSKAVETDYKNPEVIKKKKEEAAKAERQKKEAIKKRIEKLEAEILQIERANRSERRSVIEGFITQLSNHERERMKGDFALIIESDLARADFQKNGWQSLINEPQLILFFIEHCNLSFPSYDETAKKLSLPALKQLKAKKADLEGDLQK